MAARRLLFIAESCYPDRSGGADRYIFELARALVDRGHAVTVCTGWERSTPVPSAERSGVQFCRYRTPPTGPFKGYGRLAQSFITEMQRLLRQRQFDAAYVHHAIPMALCRLVPGLARLPRLAHVHMTWDAEYLIRVGGLRALQGGGSWRVRSFSRLLRSVQGWGLRAAQRIVVTTPYVRQMVLDAFPWAQPIPIDAIPGGVNIQQFTPPADRAALRRRLGLPQDDLIAVTVRRLVPRTGVPALIEAMAVLRDAGRAMRLIVVGDGPQASTIRELIQRYRLNDRVRLVGPCSNEALVDYYGAADCSVMPTAALEGFGLSIVESLACGTPVLATPVGAMPDLLRPLEPELIFPSSEPAAMADQLARWCSAPGRLTALRSRCRDYAVRGFTWQHAAERFEAVCDRLLRDRP
ncbi:MAG: glycosyltransferase family 4 protein [Candidatus Omnitrophica bacterium]|nr:glycosyltransferase family 4 protein [Candidatus Omnitrophota bacterium]